MVRLAYVLAASHSGSTVLSMLLGAQPRLCTVGELKATALGDPERYRCSCRELIGDCVFWGRVEAEMAALIAKAKEGQADDDCLMCGS